MTIAPAPPPPPPSPPDAPKPKTGDDDIYADEWVARKSSDLRNEPSLFDAVLRNLKVIVTHGDGSRAVLTRDYVHTDETIDWDELADSSGPGNVYERISGGERVAIARASSHDVIFMVPLGVLAPVAASSAEIEEWLDAMQRQWHVGSTVVSVRETGGVTELRL